MASDPMINALKWSGEPALPLPDHGRVVMLVRQLCHCQIMEGLSCCSIRQHCSCSSFAFLHVGWEAASDTAFDLIVSALQ